MNLTEGQHDKDDDEVQHCDNSYTLLTKPFLYAFDDRLIP